MAIAFDINAESERLDARKPYLELIDGVDCFARFPTSSTTTRSSG